MGMASAAMGSRQTAMPGAMVGWSSGRAAFHLTENLVASTLLHLERLLTLFRPLPRSVLY